MWQYSKTLAEHNNSIVYKNIYLTINSNKLIIFSCFYDSRYNIIRALGVASHKVNITCSYTIFSKKYECVYRYINFKKDSAGNSFKLLYMNIVIILDDRLPIPFSIEINNKPYEVIITDNREKRNSLCITTFKRFVSYNLLYQSLRIYNNYGVTHVFIYLSDYKINITKLKRIKKLVFHIIHLRNESTLIDSFYFGQTVKYNDCLYRNMYNSNYIIFTDFDELIVLNKIKNYNDLFSRIEKGDIYYFRSSICPTSNYSESKIFHILNDVDINNTLHCCMLDKYYHRKYIITTPTKFIKINIHYIDYSNNNLKSIYVNSTLGYIHHSRIPTNLLLSHCSEWFYDKSLQIQYNSIYISM